MNVHNQKLQFSNSIKTNGSGKLHLIIGPMFAGKTSHLIENYNKCKLCNIDCIVINHGDDNRYDVNLLSTHDQKKYIVLKQKNYMIFIMKKKNIILKKIVLF